MAPNLFGTSGVLLAEATIERPKQIAVVPQQTPQQTVKKAPVEENLYQWKFAWLNISAFIYLHITMIYGFYLFFAVASWGTIIFNIFYLLLAVQGVTSGAHRLWAHRTYKAKLPLRIMLAIFQTMAFQNHIYEWCRDHRVHHKFTDTDADPHNANRGFFFSHIGWLMIKKHKDVKEKGKTLDLSDLEADPVVRVQRALYPLIMPILCFLMPCYICSQFIGEDLWVAWNLTIFRYTLQLNGTWSVNSAAHIWGTRPYDKGIGPTENLFVATIAFGEGWHNYHHVFPWDYKAGELHAYKRNLSTAFIDFFAKVGWAYDLKTVTDEMITKRALRTGDGSRKSKEETLKLVSEYVKNFHKLKKDEMIWGWDDRDMKFEDRQDAIRYNNLKEA